MDSANKTFYFKVKERTQTLVVYTSKVVLPVCVYDIALPFKTLNHLRKQQVLHSLLFGMIQ